MRWLLVLAGLASIGCGSSPAASTPLPRRGNTVPLGISAHEDVPAWAPFTLVRRDADDLSWVAAVEAAGRTPVILVSYGDKATIPARVAAAHERYPTAWIEVWNEPDQAQFWGAEPDPEAYARLVAACRLAAPGARLLGPGAGGGRMDWDFLGRAAAAGLGRSLTAVSIHPYGVGDPSNLPPAVARVRGLYPGLPVVVTEWGFDSGPRQADLVARTIEAAAAAGLTFLVLYSWADSAPGPAQGLVEADGTPRPALQRLMSPP